MSDQQQRKQPSGEASPKLEAGSPSMWDSAMKGAQAASNYLLSFVGTSPPSPQNESKIGARQSPPISAATPNEHEPNERETNEHEQSVLNVWQHKATAKRPQEERKSTQLLTGSALVHYIEPGFEPLLNSAILSKIHTGIAKRFQICSKYECLYSTKQNGYSMSTLLRNCKEHNGPVVLAVKTSKGSLVGAFASEPWTPHLGHFGTGECFLFHQPQDERDSIVAFNTTGENDYYLFCDGTFVAMGVSEGKFGLWVDAELMNGASSAVATFANPPLAVEGENFTIDSVEVWGLSPP